MKVGRFVIVFLLLMGFLIAFGDNGLVDSYVMKEKLKILKDENSQTMKENDGLKKEVLLLRDNPRYIEMVARKELGMVKKGDVVYRHVE